MSCKTGALSRSWQIRRYRSKILKVFNALNPFIVILWGYLSCADRLELVKLFKMSTENMVVRDFRELMFNQPFPYT